MGNENRVDFAEAASAYREQFERERAEYIAAEQTAQAMRPASEVAAEVVQEPRENSLGMWEFWIRGDSDDDSMVVEDYPIKEAAAFDVETLRGIVAGCIEQARYDGAVEALREADARIKALFPGQHGLCADGLAQAAGVVRELAERPRRP